MGKRFEVLDAIERIPFYKIYETINDVIGTDYNGWMKACWPNTMGNDRFRMWFPKLAETKNGKLVSAAFDCVNTISDDWNQIVFDDLKDNNHSDGIHYTGYDLIFAKEPDGGPYLFRGVFVRDEDNSYPKHEVSKRIATRVKLIGNPVYDIELLDEIEGTNPVYKVESKQIELPKKKEVKAKATVRKEYNPKTQEGKLKNRILREFKKKKLLGDIQVSEEEYEILIDYFVTKYEYMLYSGQRIIIDPVFCVALIQIGIKYYDGNFWNHVRKIIDNPKFNMNHQQWIGTSFVETLKKYDKVQLGYSDRVDTMLMHGFVSDVYADNFFNFLYAFYKIDLDRDINRLDRETMNNLISIIEKNDNSGRTYFLVEHTADAVRQNQRGAKTRIRRYLKLIDKAFWGDSLPSSSSNRIMHHFLVWKDTAAEFVQERSAHGGSGKRGMKSYSTPYMKYNGKTEKFKIVLPAQIIRFQDFSDMAWKIESAHYCDVKEINPYAQGVTGYKTDSIEIDLMTEELFDGFNISLMDGDEKLRTFRIAEEPIRFFDEDGDFIRTDSVSQGIVYSYTRSGFKPESEAIIESFDNGLLIRTAYEFVNGDIVRVPDGKPITIGGKLAEGIMNRGSVDGVIAGELRDRMPIYKEVPDVFIKMLPQRAAGTAIRVNDKIYHFRTEKGLAKGISEFDLMDRTGEKGYLIKLGEFGCKKDSIYNFSVDVPNDRTIRQWKFVLINGLEYEFEDAPYIFKSRGTLCVSNAISFKSDVETQVEGNNKLFNFDINPGQAYLNLEYLGISIGFEIPTISYKFHGGDWHIGPHVDIWHSEFEPRLFVTYNADSIRIFLDELDGDDEEHLEIFYKNKSKGLFDCDLNRFKSWFGREKVFRQIYMELPGLKGPIPFVKIVTQSVFNSGLIKADFENYQIIGEFDIIGYSDFYVDIEFENQLIVEKQQLKDKRLLAPSELKTGIYTVKVYESEEDEFGFGDSIYYEIGSFKSELLNPADLSGMSIEVTRIHSAEDEKSYLPLSTTYLIADLKHFSEDAPRLYTGKMIVGSKQILMATFPVLVEFYDLDKLQKTYITFLDEDDEEGYEFLYDDYKRFIVKQEDKSIAKSQAYRRFKLSLFPEDYIYEVKFIERPINADKEINDESYNNLKKVNSMKRIMNESIFK